MSVSGGIISLNGGIFQGGTGGAYSGGNGGIGLTITNGSITINGGTCGYGADYGKSGNAINGTVTIGEGCVVKGGNSADPTDTIMSLYGAWQYVVATQLTPADRLLLFLNRITA